MKITNLYGLPEPIINAVKAFSHRPYTGNISITELIGPPMIRVLKNRCYDKLTEDATDRIWSLFGSAVHSILDKGAQENAFNEERLFIKMDGWHISGASDIFDDDGVLSDYKVVGVYGYLLGDGQLHQEQLNCYAYLWRQSGFEINKLQIVFILRDWIRSKAVTADYPEHPVMIKDIPLWDEERQLQFIKDRLKLHIEAEDGNIVACTPSERWRRPDKWTLMKTGRKSAVRVLDSEQEAFAYQADNGLIGAAYSVVKRPGGDVRCESFCPVREFCAIKEILVEEE